jgi:hypothetical protein
VVVDRGPGNASQLGQATYGGNINMYSRAVSDKQGVTGQALLGNWNSFIGRVELQTGKIDKWNGAKFALTGQYLKSDGALTNSPVMSKNLFFKGVIPLVIEQADHRFDVEPQLLLSVRRAEGRDLRLCPVGICDAQGHQLLGILEHRHVRLELWHGR